MILTSAFNLLPSSFYRPTVKSSSVAARARVVLVDAATDLTFGDNDNLAQLPIHDYLYTNGGRLSILFSKIITKARKGRKHEKGQDLGFWICSNSPKRKRVGAVASVEP
jgi:hypothetical protein